MKISVHDLAHSKGMPTAATEAMLLMQDRIEALTAEVEALREALRGSLGALEQDLDTGRDYGDADWEGIGFQRLEAARAALGDTQ